MNTDKQKEKSKEKPTGVYVNISPEVNKKLVLVTTLMPPKKGGRTWFKRDIVAFACEKFVDKFLGYLDGAKTLDEMIEKAKEINPDEIEFDIPIGSAGSDLREVVPDTKTDGDLPDEDTGLREF